ncbi:uncharacterized protein LOC134791607 [Cydia splendana]|uniref:uncharacterized protein LOC134791607 n=1 Tax=Cydia splendana TaxID=1100963 RepID=UPI00300C5CC1
MASPLVISSKVQGFRQSGNDPEKRPLGRHRSRSRNSSPTRSLTRQESDRETSKNRESKYDNSKSTGKLKHFTSNAQKKSDYPNSNRNLLANKQLRAPPSRYKENLTARLRRMSSVNNSDTSLGLMGPRKPSPVVSRRTALPSRESSRTRQSKDNYAKIVGNIWPKRLPSNTHNKMDFNHSATGTQMQKKGTSEPGQCVQHFMSDTSNSSTQPSSIFLVGRPRESSRTRGSNCADTVGNIWSKHLPSNTHNKKYNYSGKVLRASSKSRCVTPRGPEAVVHVISMDSHRSIGTKMQKQGTSELNERGEDLTLDVTTSNQPSGIFLMGKPTQEQSNGATELSQRAQELLSDVSNRSSGTTGFMRVTWKPSRNCSNEAKKMEKRSENFKTNISSASVCNTYVVDNCKSNKSNEGYGQPLVKTTAKKMIINPYPTPTPSTRTHSIGGASSCSSTRSGSPKKSFTPLSDIESSYFILKKKLEHELQSQDIDSISQKTERRNRTREAINQARIRFLRRTQEFEEGCKINAQKPAPLREDLREMMIRQSKKKFQSKQYQCQSKFEKIEGLNWISWPQ